MSTEASKHDKTGLSKIALIDAVANYFKHSYEWPDGWVGAAQKQQDTINLVLMLGLVPSGDQNLETAMRELGMGAHDMAPLSVLVHEWRERLAAHFRGQMNKHGFDFHTSH